MGRLGGSVGWASDFGSGHDLTVREFEPRIGLWADGSEPGACFRFCVSLSLSAPPPFMLCLSVSKINKTLKKLKKKNKSKFEQMENHMVGDNQHHKMSILY